MLNCLKLARGADFTSVLTLTEIRAVGEQKQETQGPRDLRQSHDEGYFS